MLPIIALTAGEPAGIGPDLCLLLGVNLPTSLLDRARVVVVADRDLLRERAKLLGVSLNIADFDSEALAAAPPGTLVVMHEPAAVGPLAGVLNPANSRYVLRTLERAADGCLKGIFAAMVTAPVHKGVINDAGIPFTGHTEFLRDYTGARQVVMMLAGGGMRVALATTHVAVKDIARSITREGLETTLRILHHDLQTRFGIPSPRILVAGLNPHAGESGHLGREEIDVIIPVIKKLNAEGMDLRGPLPADTLFQPSLLEEADSVLAMYHDQGLPVLKYASFGAGVNITLGLPILRTSVDHGTALELAGTGNIDPGSLMAAIDAAIQMAERRIDPPQGVISGSGGRAGG